MKKIAIALFVLAWGIPAAAGEELSRLQISAPQHPGATVRIFVHGCDAGIPRVNGQFVSPQTIVRLDNHGHAITRLFANDKEMYCSPIGLQRVWSTSYGIKIMEGGKVGKEKLVKLRAGKTARVKL